MANTPDLPYVLPDEHFPHVLFIVWSTESGSPRARLLAQLMGAQMERVFFTHRRGFMSALFRYPLQFGQTLIRLQRRHPEIVIVQTPPVFAILAVTFWHLVTHKPYIIDAHTTALTGRMWHWARPLFRVLVRQARLTLVTGDALAQMISEWGGHSLIVMDPPDLSPERAAIHLSADLTHVLVSSVNRSDRLLRAVLQAAELLPDVRFHMTGLDQPNWAQHDSTERIRWLGYLPDDVYYGLMQACDMVMSLTEDEDRLKMGASEALWQGKPVIVSNTQLLRSYLESAAYYVDNTSHEIVDGIRHIQQHQELMKAECERVKQHRIQDWEQQFRALMPFLRIEKS